jgi:drug/metabolite transporter (DMT)-like permease
MMAFLGGSLAGVANASYGVFITNYGTALTGIVTIISVPASVLLVIAVLHERYSVSEIAGLIVTAIGLGVALIL